MASKGVSRKRTGGRKRPHRDRRKHEQAQEPTETELDETRLKVVDVRGTERKVRALATDDVVLATDAGTIVTTIEDVVENPANPNYVRRNILTKGTVIDTPEGRARITSRPGQTGQVCAVLLT